MHFYKYFETRSDNFEGQKFANLFTKEKKFLTKSCDLKKYKERVHKYVEGVKIL